MKIPPAVHSQGFLAEPKPVAPYLSVPIGFVFVAGRTVPVAVRSALDSTERDLHRPVRFPLQPDFDLKLKF